MSAFAHLPYRPGVGIMLVNHAGLVFVGQRLDNRAEAWQMPQGGIDAGEAPDQAALRELEEETGVVRSLVTIAAQTAAPIDYDLPDDLIPRLWKGRFRGQRQHWFLMRFTGPDSAIDVATAEPEFGAWQWAAPDRLSDMIVPFKRALYGRVIAELAPHI